MRSVAPFLFCLFILFASSCVRLSESDVHLSQGDTLTVNLKVCPASSSTHTRSSVPYQDDKIESYFLMAYYQGRLETVVHSSSSQSVQLSLVAARSYQLYAVANFPDFEPPHDEKELFSYALPAGDFQDGLPMAWSCTDFSVQQNSSTLYLQFERLFARLRVKVDKGLLSQWTVQHARLCQVSSYVYPFSSSRAADRVCEGDWASDEDLLLLNQGGEMVFYVPENVQGALLPPHAGPFSRVPENLGERASLCTYLQVEGAFEQDSGVVGTSSLRIYLGQNAADDFSIPRNSTLDLTLCLSERLLSEVGWKIESSASFEPGAVLAWVEEGMHATDELCKGEIFKYAIRPVGSLQALMVEHIEKCSILCVSPTSVPSSASPCASVSAPIRFSPLRYFQTDGTGTWYVEGHCMDCVENAEIHLFMNGRSMAVLAQNVSVCLPQMKLEGPSECLINAVAPSVFRVAFRDERGHSLAEAYGFDPSVYDFQYTLSSESLKSCPSAFSCSIIPPASDCLAGALSLQILHDGTDDSLNRFLTESLGKENEFYVKAQMTSTPHVAEADSSSNSVAPLCHYFKTELRPLYLLFFESGVPNDYVQRLSQADVASRSSVGRYFPKIAPLDGYLSQEGDDWVMALHNPSLLPVNVGLVMAAPSHETQTAQPSYDGLVPKEINALMYENQCFKVVDREFLALDKNYLRRSGRVYQYVSDSTLVLPLHLGQKSLERHLCAHAGKTATKYMGIETSLYYALPGSHQLDGKVEVFYNASDGSVNLYQFASDKVQWISKNSLLNPSWLRYSHYDDIHNLTLSLSCQDRRMWASCQCSDPSMTFDLRVKGTVTARLFLYPDGTMWNGYWWVSQEDFQHQADAMSADGQAYLLPGNYWEKMDALYAIAPQDDNTILGTNEYNHHLRPEESEYRVELSLKGDVGLVIPRYESNLDSQFYHEQDGLLLQIRSQCSYVSGERFYLYDM